MKILLSRKESSTNDVTHTSLCHSMHIVFSAFSTATQLVVVLKRKKKKFYFTTLFSFVEQLFAQQQHQQRLKPAHLTAFNTQRVHSQLMSHYYCENLKVVVFCFCRLHNYNNKSNTNFFLSLSK